MWVTAPMQSIMLSNDEATPHALSEHSSTIDPPIASSAFDESSCPVVRDLTGTVNTEKNSNTPVRRIERRARAPPLPLFSSTDPLDVSHKPSTASYVECTDDVIAT